MSSFPVVHTCDEHSSVYFHLVASGSRGVSLTHLDAHCDLKGTLIDKDAGRAWLRRADLPVSGSTYLSHLVAEGVVRDVEWVHDEVGGRANDLGTVLYTSDLTKLAYRMVRRPAGAGVPIVYRETGFAAWRQTDAERVLDVDWDFFADWRKSAERASREIDLLLNEKLAVTPRRVYVAYSPHYSRPGRAVYSAFVDRLAQRLSARIEALPEAPIPAAGTFARALPPTMRRMLRASAVRLKHMWFR